jgi:hypothetical protein
LGGSGSQQVIVIEPDSREPGGVGRGSIGVSVDSAAEGNGAADVAARGKNRSSDVRDLAEAVKVSEASNPEPLKL